MTTYGITTDHRLVPAFEVTASDPYFDLAHQVALRLAKRGVLRPGGYDVEVNEKFGAITQSGRTSPIYFHITKEK